MSALQGEDRERLVALAESEETRARFTASPTWADKHRANANLLRRLAEHGCSGEGEERPCGTGEKPVESWLESSLNRVKENIEARPEHLKPERYRKPQSEDGER